MDDQLDSIDGSLASPASQPFTRRGILAALAGLGLGTAAFQRALALQAEQAGKITPELVQQAEWIAGISLSDDDRKSIAGTVERDQRRYEALRKIALSNSVPPALAFFAAPPQQAGEKLERSDVHPIEWSALVKPQADEDLAFLPVTELAALIRSLQVSSVELTKLYLSRLRKYDDLLKCVVTLTEELALKQAERADREIAAGRYRGPLHGIPW